MKKSLIGSAVAILLLALAGCTDIELRNLLVAIVADGDGTIGSPIFAGLSAATAISATEVRLSWTAATDDATAQSDIINDVYLSTAPGGQDFSSPTHSTAPGATEYIVQSLSTWSPCFFVVRARDTEGKRDGNTVEQHDTPMDW